MTLVDNIKAIYAQSSVGCCLHIVLDDNNLETSSVQFCLEFAKREGCQLCAKTAEMLLALRFHERVEAMIASNHICPCCAPGLLEEAALDRTYATDEEFEEKLNAT